MKLIGTALSVTAIMAGVGGFEIGICYSKAQPPIQTLELPPPTEFIFMVVHAVDHGQTVNEKFFIGRLPKVGEAVEMVYVAPQDDGGMKFQLRTKATESVTGN